jgi:hypothetical protein
MFIFWGTRKTESKEGYVAEFCPVCREITSFQLRRIGMADHLYGVSLGKGKTLGHAAICEGCQTQIGVDAMDYRAFARRPGQNLQVLIDETFPNIRKSRSERLILEDKVRSGELDDADRQAMLMEPFHIFSAATEANFTGQIHIQGRGGWGCLGTFVIAFAVVIIGNAIWAYPEERERITTAAMGIMVLGGLYSFVQLLLEPRRIFARRILPGLAKALRPLHPTKDELAGCLERFNRAGFKIGRKTKLDVLWNAVQQADREPGSALQGPEAAAP